MVCIEWCLKFMSQFGFVSRKSRQCLRSKIFLFVVPITSIDQHVPKTGMTMVFVWLENLGDCFQIGLNCIAY